ncbi:hypothetical protein H2200_010905 [Cladophialophora chaetospira]|uniref:NAD-dependent epimerase/dehydratase domain-containing protein n=1 Tax=Cladophialophora chaetospira TaxID=386627 RepID=A0AA39CDX2_9EURO|nr:hypothetical protein H2200_010905 [Cladophialophora chaetospira]
MAPSSQRRLAKNDIVLVTGANGYIATHIVDVLLTEGYRVRGTVRGEKPWLNKLFDDRHGKGRFESISVPSLDGEGVYDEAIKGVSGVVVVATQLTWSSDPNEGIPPVVAGTISLLKAAAAESTVKSVVLTSSSSAAIIPEVNKEVVVDENTWNDSAVETAWAQTAPEDIRPYVVYAASKTEGERAAWKWHRETKPNFELNTVLPNWNTGTILSPEIAGSTMGWTANLLKGDTKVIREFPPEWYIDVIDCARVHVAALLDPAVKSERLFAFAGQFNWTDVVGILRDLRPNNKKIPDAPENEGRDLSDIRPSIRAEQLIKDFFGVPGWTSLRDTLEAGIVGLE